MELNQNQSNQTEGTANTPSSVPPVAPSVPAVIPAQEAAVPLMMSPQPSVISPTTVPVTLPPASPLVESTPALPLDQPVSAVPSATSEALAAPVAPVVSTSAPAPVTTPTVVGNGAAQFQPSSLGSVSGPTVSTPFVGGGDDTPPPQRFGKKKLLIAAGSVVAVLALVSGVVFGLYLPNTPNGVWSTGINRSGKALDSLITTATTPAKLSAYKTSSISGSVKATLADSTYSGDFSTTFDKTSQDGGLNITLKENGTDQKVSAKVLSQIPSGSSYPDIYFQITGLKPFGLDSYVPGISNYDGKWIYVSSDYLKSIGDTYLTGTDNTKKQVTTDDIAEVARATSGVTKEYLFSTSKDKGVFIKQSFVAKEKIEGINAYHYKVGVDIDHAKAYCVALDTAVLSTKAFAKLSGEDAKQIAADKKTAADGCASTVNDTVKSSDTFDLWIDGKYKLIYKFRAYDKSNKEAYTDVGQIYKGGDQLSLFVNYHDAKNKSDANFTLDTNLKTNSTKGVFTAKSTNADYPYTVTASLQASASTKAVTITKPAGAASIQDVLKALGLGNLTDDGSGSLTVTAKAEDSERKTDILTLQSNIEAYYAVNAFYPTLAHINDPSWRKTNMPGLDSDALKDPKGSSAVLLTNATATQYGYAPANATTDGFQSYTVSALLSDGTLFEKTSLN